MTERLDDRLRDHLSSLDAIPVEGPDAVTAAVARSAGRRARRRRTGAAVGAGALLVAGVALIMTNRTAPDEVASVDTDAVAGTTAPTPADDTAVTVSTTVDEPVAGQSAPTDAPVWTLIPDDPRGPTGQPSVVWTGTEAIAIGGLDPSGVPRASTAAYDPAAGSWRVLADQPEVANVDPLVAWTGRDVLVIGGDQADGTPVLSASRAYDPASDTWRAAQTPPLSFVTDRSPAVWTGTELLVWPFQGATPIPPLAYDPAADDWRELPLAPIAPREHAASVWTGSEWIVWGGATDDGAVADGAAYDPATETWRVLAPSPLSARKVNGVWTGGEMIVAAGSRGGDRITGNGELALADGAAYDPASDSWRPIAAGPAHPGFEPVWTGDVVVMFAKGGAVIYDPAVDEWTDACCPASVGAFGDSPVWTGSEAVLLGETQDGNGGATFTVPASAGEPTETTVSTTTSLLSAGTDCDDPDRPDLDVAGEPDWRQFADYQEWTRGGCLVRIDVLADRPGPDHCDMQSARVIITGIPLGARYTSAGDDAEYLRDPNGVLGANERFEEDATLPPGAVDTGYRSASGEALWIVPDDPSSIYLADDGHIERWPQGTSALCS